MLNTFIIYHIMFSAHPCIATARYLGKCFATAEICYLGAQARVFWQSARVPFGSCESSCTSRHADEAGYDICV